ncbi:MAG: MerR family transcriptional regulator [Candidatus Acidiferrum sp.]
MKIGELAERARLAPSGIRYYEKIGLLARAERIGGQRRYSTDELDRVLLIRFAGEMDFTLAEIKLFLNGFRENTPVSTRWRKLTTRKIAELQQRLGFTRRLLTLLERLQHCHCADLHQCVTGLGLSPRLAALRNARGKTSPTRRTMAGTATDSKLMLSATKQTTC